MKKSLLVSVLFFSVYGLFAQTKTVVPAGMTKKDSMLCNEWKLVSIEEFGVDVAPEEKQKNDGVGFSLDKKAHVTHDGVTKTGTWSTDKGKTFITVVVDNTQEKRPYKILKFRNDTLGLEYQDKTLIRTRYLFVKAK